MIIVGCLEHRDWQFVSLQERQIWMFGNMDRCKTEKQLSYQTVLHDWLTLYTNEKEGPNCLHHQCSKCTAAKTGTDTLKWNHAGHLCYEKLQKKHWCVQWSRFGVHATLHPMLWLTPYIHNHFKSTISLPPIFLSPLVFSHRKLQN